VGPWLTPIHRARCQAAAACALQFAQRCISEPEAGPSSAVRPREPRDRSLGWVSALVRTVHSSLSGLTSPATATGQVLPVQCTLAQAMLAAGTFNLQLAGVREINSLLDAVHPPPPVIGPSASAAVTPVGAAAASTALLTLKQPGSGDSRAVLPAGGALDNDALPGGGFIQAGTPLALLSGGADGDAELFRSLWPQSTPPELPSPVTAPPVETAEFARLAAYAVGWVNATGVVATALRGALHLKQYVEQVERIMRCLLRAGALPDDHLALVWDMSQRADTFEETKANLFAMLASLAGEFSPGQLDALFQRFEEQPSAGTSAADQGRTLGLVLALARGDTTGAMAGRLTRLLWHKLMEEQQHHGGVARQDSQMDVRMDTGAGPSTGAAAAAAPLAEDGTAPRKAVLDTLVEMCGHYVSSPVGQAALEELLVMCVEALRQRCGVGTSPVVVLLRCLLEQQQQPRAGDITGGSDVAQRTRALDARYGLHGLLLDDVCSYAAAHPAGLEGITRRLQLLLNLLQWADTCLDAGPVERLWAATVAGPASQGGNTACASWFSDACKGYIISAKDPFAARSNPSLACVLTQDACRRVLALVAAIPAAEQTAATYTCASGVIVILALSAGALAMANRVEQAGGGWNQTYSGAMAAAGQRSASMPAMRVLSLDFDGLAYMWDLVTRGSEGIAPLASVWLADIFQMLHGPTAVATSRLRKSFLEHATQRLQQAASDVLAGTSAGQQQMEAQRARRTIHLLLQLLRRDQGQDTGGAQPRPHVASYRGRGLELELGFQGGQVPSPLSTTAVDHVRVVPTPNGGTKLVMGVWAHEYYTSLHAKVGALLSVPQDRVRLISGGNVLGDSNTGQHMCERLRMPVVVTFRAEIFPPGAVVTPLALPSPIMEVDAVADTSPALPGTPLVAPADAQQPATQPASPPHTPPPAGPAAPAEPDLPSARQLVAAVPGVYDTLLSLADCPPVTPAVTPAQGLTLCDAALELLGLLPTQVELLEQVKAILVGASSDAIAAQARLGALLATPVSRRAYVLQILDGLVHPVNSSGDEQLPAGAVIGALQALHATKHILAALHPRNVSACGGISALRALYLTGLNVLNTSRLADEAAASASAMAPDSDTTIDMLAWLLPRVARGFAPSDVGGVLAAAGDEKGDVSMDSAAVTSAAASDTDGDAMAVSSGGGGPAVVFATPVSAKRSTANWEVTEEMPPDDMHMTQKALDLLLSVAEHHAAGLLPLLNRADATTVVANILLLCPHDDVRSRFREVCSDLVLPRETNATNHGATAASPGSNAGVTGDHAPSRRQLLNLLLGLRLVADSDGCAATCAQYFELTAQLLSRHSHEAAAAGAHSGAGATLEGVLQQEVLALLTCGPCTDADDYRLCGHLQLVLALVKGISRRGILTPSGVPLLTVLLKRFLFPEAAIIESLPADGNDNAQAASSAGRQPVVHDIEAEALSLTAIASTPDSRFHALELVVALATRDVGALKAVGDVLSVLHTYMTRYPWGNGIQAWYFERTPASLPRPDRGYVGLANGGATCYMNSVFQQLFMQPDIRRGVLEASDAAEGNPSDSVLCQLQTIFGALLAYKQDHYRPENFWKAFKDYDGQPVNVREHQDALEFLLRLQDQVDAAVKRSYPAQQPPALEGGEGDGDGAQQQQQQPVGAIERVLGGVLVSQIVCRTCPAHRSERDEVINSLAVDIRNKSGLVESLGAYVQGELLEGDNKWECEQCGCKVDAVKRQVIKELPHTLCFQLKRFEFDYETMQRLKVKDRFEFPQHLDMRPFTLDDDPAAAASGDKPEWYYNYTLMGVVVHSGSAFAGHYYSYIRERVEPAPGSGGTVTPGPWYVFDDRRVEPYDAVNLERDTFGGKYQTETWDAFRQCHVTSGEHDRPNSAYMLFFERLGEPQQAGAGAAAAAAAAAATAAATAAAEPPTAPPVRLPARVAAEVRSANAECVFESHVLSKEYFTFVRQLVETNADAAASRKRRRPAAAAAAAALTSSAGPAGPGGDAVSATSDELLVDIGLSFLYHVFSRSGAALRDDAVGWTTLVSTLVEGSPTASRHLLKWLAAKEHSLQLFTLTARCPVEGTRELWRALFSCALAAGVSHDDGAEDYTTLMEVLGWYEIGPADSSGRSDASRSLPEWPERAVSPTVTRLDDTSPAEDVAWAQSSSVLLNAALMRLVGFIPRATLIKSKAEVHVGNVLVALKAYAEIGPVQRGHLVALRTIPYMLDYLDQKLVVADFAPRPDGPARQAAFAGIYGLMSILVRGAGGAHSSGASSRGAHARGSLPNPHALSTDGAAAEAVPPLVSETRGVLLENCRAEGSFLRTLGEVALNNSDARDLLLYLCWDDESFSNWFVAALIRKLNETAVHPDMQPRYLLHYLHVLTALVSMEDRDERQQQRACVLLTGQPQNSRQQGNGLLRLLTFYNVDASIRTELMRWLLRLLQGQAVGYWLKHLLVSELAVHWQVTYRAVWEEVQRAGAAQGYSPTATMEYNNMMAALDEVQAYLEVA
jgi:ubiquitin C-terminal hydrolase